MADQKLNEAEARLAALDALAALLPGECVLGATIGEFAAGGFYWNITVCRQLGNTQATLNPRIDSSIEQARLAIVAGERRFGQGR